MGKCRYSLVQGGRVASEKKDEWASESSLVQGGRVASEKKDEWASAGSLV